MVDKGVETALLDRSADKDDALRYLTYVMVDRLYSFALNCDLNSKMERWSELLKYNSKAVSFYKCS